MQFGLVLEQKTMAQSNWEADKMLDVYIYDYLMKKKLHATAKSFMTEGKVAPDPVAIDAPGGFLFEWWSVFWDIFIARTNDKHSDTAAAYIEGQQVKTKEQQLQMHQLQLMRQAQLQRRDPNHPPLGSPGNAINSEGMLGQSTASALAAKMYEERLKHSNPMDSETSQPLLDARMALLKSTTNHPGQLVQGNSGSVNAALQQIQDIKSEVNIGATQRSLPMDPSPMYAQGIMQSKPGIGNSGLNPGVGGLPLKGWPLTGIDQIRPGLGAQVQKPYLQNANQFPLLPQQQLLAQVQAQGNLGSSPIYGDMDPQRFRGLSRGTLNAKDGQPIANDGSIGSPMQSTSSKINMPQIQQSSSQQQQDPLHPQQVQQDDMDHFGDVGSLDDNVESFLSHDDGDGRDLFGAMKRNPSEHHAETSKGFSFNEVGSMCKSNSKVVCCHFSSDGKLLASAGHDKKVVLWNMETLQTESTPEEHGMIITDVRFRPNSTQLATSSFDTTVRIWDAANYVSQPFTGHASHVMSLDFSPKNNEILCSCDANSEIRFWNINQYSCTRAFKASFGAFSLSVGGSAQVRFQPRIGQLLAAAAEKVVSIFDVETDRQTHSLRGHTTDVHSICWDTNGDYLASASQESVRVWSLASGDCIHELSSSGNMYHSCVFHPSYSTLLVIGGYQSLELWNLAENKCMTIAAHDCVIAALSQSPLTGMVASASHDKSVKIWK
ncbi:hypothetical protein RGQ29_023098 [Quercus rubra]|uniref:Uncharacterized protein n=2 Tax=Quercus rubra TaxID=3512 RepID=A0AAN7ITS5_QUERU|nr:hypothetical protein RGQ29_023098 [Quercus rubra]